MTPKNINKYQIVKQIGSGTTGAVYLAKDPDIERLVAVKVMKSEFFGEPSTLKEAIKRFATEIKAIGRLNHPNIVPVFDSGVTEQEIPFLVMPYIEGKGLDQILKDHGGALPTKNTLNILRQLASAIDYIHSEKVVHRDIKPGNILIGKNEHVYLLDFSTATFGDHNVQISNSGQIIGTPQFMAPEVIRGKQATEYSDFFSLAVTAFLLFTGKRPFRDGDVSDTFSSTLNHSALSFAELECKLGAKLERVLRRSLSKEPEDRYSSSLEFVSSCEKALGSPQADVFSQTAPAFDVSDPASSGIFQAQTRKSLRGHGQSRSEVFASLIKLTLVIIIASLTTLVIVLFVLENDLPYHQTLREKLGLAVKVADIKSISDNELIQLLASEAPEDTLKFAIFEANQRDTEDLANTVSTLINDPRRDIRIEAIKSIGLMKSLSLQARKFALTKGLQDEDPFIKIFSATELAKFKVESAREIISKQRELEQDLMATKVLDFILENCQPH